MRGQTGIFNGFSSGVVNATKDGREFGSVDDDGDGGRGAPSLSSSLPLLLTLLLTLLLALLLALFPALLLDLVVEDRS